MIVPVLDGGRENRADEVVLPRPVVEGTDEQGDHRLAQIGMGGAGLGQGIIGHRWGIRGFPYCLRVAC